MTRSKIKSKARSASTEIRRATTALKVRAKKGLLNGSDSLGLRLGSLIAKAIINYKNILKELEKKLIELA